MNASSHEWVDCPNTQRIEDVRERVTTTEQEVDTLKITEAHRAGAEAMLKWILGFVGFGTLIGVAAFILNVVDTVK